MVKSVCTGMHSGMINGWFHFNFLYVDECDIRRVQLFRTLFSILCYVMCTFVYDILSKKCVQSTLELLHLNSVKTLSPVVL